MWLRPATTATAAAARPGLPRKAAEIYATRAFASAETPPPPPGGGQDGQPPPPPPPPPPGNPYGKNLEKQLSAKKKEMRSQLDAGKEYLRSLWAERAKQNGAVEVDSEWLVGSKSTVPQALI